MYNFDVKKLYADVVYIIESLDGIVSKSTLNRRKYIHFLDAIKECYDDKSKIKSAKNTEILKQLANCQKCKCFKCDKECITDGCNRCEPGGFVAMCDNDTVTVYHFKNKSFELKSNKLSNIETYVVLAIIQDVKYNEYFIVLHSKEKKYIAYYYPEIGGDTFGEIKSIDDLDFAIKAFEDSEVESI